MAKKKNRKVWVVSDTHLGHKNIVNFRKELGFKDVEEHDEFIIKNWNETVGENDKVYVLGDACFYKKDLHKIAKLNGTKVLIGGNHDWENADTYLTVFKNIRGLLFLDNYKVWLSHAPMHKIGMRGYKNVHGHTHGKHIRTIFGFKDKNYINVCLENTNYKPVLLEELLK